LTNSGLAFVLKSEWEPLNKALDVVVQ